MPQAGISNQAFWREGLYRAMRHGVACGVMLLDKQGVVRLVNRAMTRIIGEAAAGLAGRSLPQAPGSSFLGRFSELYRKAAHTLAETSFEHKRLPSLDSGSIIASGKLIPLSKHGKLTGMVFTIRDLSELVLAKDKARRLSWLVSENPMPILCTSRQGTISYANPAAGPILRCLKTQEGAMLPQELVERLSRACLDGQSELVDIVCQDQSHTFVLAPCQEGVNLYLYGIGAELSSSELDEVRGQALHSARHAMAMFTRQGRAIYANPALYRLWSINPDQESFLSFQSLWQSRELAKTVFAALFAQDEWSGELMAKRGDDESFRVRVSANRLKSQSAQSGDTQCVAVWFHDISRSLHDQAALRESREKYRALVEASSDLIWEVDPRGRYTYASPKTQDILGYSPEDIIGKTPFSLMSRDEARRTSELFVYHAKARTSFSSVQLLMQHSDGRDIWLEVSGAPYFNDAGSLSGFRGVARDISERKQAKEAVACHLAQDPPHINVGEPAGPSLAQPTRGLAPIRDTVAKDLICRSNAKGRLTYINTAMSRMFSLAKDQPGQHRIKDLVHELDVEKHEQHMRSLTESRPVAGLVSRARLDGEGECWLQWVHRAVFDQGEIKEFQSMGRDITAKVKNREAALQGRYEVDSLRVELEAVFDSISEGVIIVDKDMNLVKANPALDHVCTRSGGIVENWPLTVAFSAEESPPCVNLLRQVLETNEPVRGYRAECSCANQPNQVTLINATPYHLDGELAGAVVVIRDITEKPEQEPRREPRTLYHGMRGKSPKMQAIYQVLDQLSEMKTTVLITGESGTGKELIVEALHYGSSRITGPLVKVNCSALAETILESELFGHVRGAFTGAVKDTVGRFQAAEGGTIFLDEIGDLSRNIQLKLLRVLETKEYERVGDSTTCKADVRLVAATNVDLWDKVKQGTFRQDLFYRLKVMTIHVPPLRERAEDIPLLIDHFLTQVNETYAKSIEGVTNEVMNLFMHYHWPGNVREFKHAIEHGGILCPGGFMSLGHLPGELRQAASGQAPAPAPGKRRVSSDREHMLAILEQSRWNKTKASELLGVSRTTLYRKLKELDITV